MLESSQLTRAGSTLSDAVELAARARTRARLFGAALAGDEGKIGRYEILRQLGAGGMGTVYAAYDEQLDRRVALKMLLPGLEKKDRVRVEREARAMARLTHPNVVQVYEVGHHGGELYIAMEHVDGRTLEAWRRDEDVSWKVVVEVYRQAGRGLAAAHHQGLVHRDFKPQNAMVSQSQDGGPIVKVLDFGLALHGDDGDEVDRPMGTPAYMAPEQFSTSNVSAAADQFAFCVALWEALYLEHPFDGGSIPELAANVCAGTRRPVPRESPVPARIARVVGRGLRVDPADRWPSIDALLDALAPPPSSRPGWTPLIATAVACLAALTALATTLHREPCDDIPTVGEAWDEQRSQAVRSAMLGQEVDFAMRSWQHADQAIDEYARRWERMQLDACEATRVRNERPAEVMMLELACLERARTRLDAVTAVLREADAEVTSRARDLVASLPDLDRCGDLASLENSVEPPSAAQAASVSEARRKLAEARAEREAGRFARALARVEDASRAAGAAAYGPVSFEVALEEGLVLADLGSYASAQSRLTEALRLATRQADSEAMQRAAVALLYVVGYQLGDPSEAMTRYELLARELPRESEVEEAFVHSRLGSVLGMQGNYEEAVAEHRKALRIVEGLHGAASPEVATHLDTLGVWLLELSEIDEAIAMHRRALRIRREALGPGHPSVATSHINLASAVVEKGLLQEAEAEARLAIDIATRALGPRHPNVAAAHNNLGAILAARRRYEESVAEHRTALEIRRESLGEEHVEVARSHANLASSLIHIGRFEESEQHYARALEIYEAALPPDHAWIAVTRGNLASLYYRTERYEEAAPLQRLGLETLESSLGLDHPNVAIAAHNLGTTLAELGRVGEATLLLDRALAVAQRHWSSHDRRLATLMLARAELPVEPEEGFRWASRALAVFEAEPGVERARATLLRGIFGHATGRLSRAEARALVKSATQALIEAETPHAAAIARARAWLGERETKEIEEVGEQDSERDD